MRSEENASSLAFEAYSVVRQRILTGQLHIGQSVSRRQLACELGISFLPASEALLRLEFEGLIESRPRVGTRVRVPSAADVRGQFVVREALEVQAALLFQREATVSERTQLMRMAARVDALSRRNDRTLYYELHQQLHRRIAECTRCDALREAVEHAHALASMWFCAGDSSIEGPRQRHQDLIAAIVSDDPAVAEQAVRAHVQFGLAHALKTLQPCIEAHAGRRAFPRTR